MPRRTTPKRERAHEQLEHRRKIYRMISQAKESGRMRKEDRFPKEPVDSGSGESTVDAKHENPWYSGILAELDEPSLFQVSNDKARRAYRFLYLPSFSSPITVRLEIANDGSGEVHV